MKRKYLFALVIFFSVCSIVYSQSTICAYKYRKRITFDPTKVSGSSDLTNFPALINISSDNDLRTVANSGHVESSSGFDILFTAADGVTLLNFQLEKYTATNGQFTAWVKIPILSTSINTDIYMYYGNTAIVSDQSSTSVWTNYHGVWHLENSSFSDNSPSGFNLTNNGTTNQAPAFINGGRANNGTQWLEVANTFPNITSDFTMSAWFYSSNVGTAGQRVFCDDVSNSGGYALSLGDPGSGALRFFARSTSPVSLDTPNNTLVNNTWYYVSAVADVTNKIKRIFVNGVQIVSATYTGNWGTDAGNCSVAGETAAGETANRLNGRIDEVHVAKSALSADWLLTEYNNQNSPSTFYSISVEPAVWTGVTNSNWNTNGNWLSGTVPASGEDIILPNVANQPNLNASKQIASLWIRTGTTLSFGNNRILSVAYDITNCGTITGGGGTSGVVLNSGNTNTQIQHLSGSGTYNFTELTINNTYSLSPNVLLSKDVNVSDALTLTSGIVNTTSTNILALGTTATSSSGSASSFVNGPMTKDGTAAFDFPIGKGTRWRRLGISAPSSSTNFRAEYFDTPYTTTTNVNAPLNNVSSIEYWQLDQLSGSGSANVTLFWEAANTSGITNCPDLSIARWNGASWDERVASTTGGSSCAGAGAGAVTTTAVVTAFSPFTFGSKLSSVNPLPIELMSFESMCQDEGIELKWATATEKNNAYFKLERSKNGKDWLLVQVIKGAGNSQNTEKYSYTDTEASKGELYYYRLSQVDVIGTSSTFNPIAVNCDTNLDLIKVFPNPANNELFIEFNLSQNYGLGELILVNTLGKNCLEEKIDLKKGKITIKLSLNIEPGPYVLKLNSEVLNFAPQKIIIQ